MSERIFPKNGGRPRTLLSDETRIKHEVQLLIKQGLSLRKACAEAGTNPSTIARWRERDATFDNAMRGLLEQAGTYRPAATVKDTVRTAPMLKDVTSNDKENIVAEVCKGLAFGMELDFSCMLASVDKRVLRDWMMQDSEIMVRINQARAKNMAWWIEKIRKGAETDWRAAVVYLERMFPALWAEVKQVEISARNDDMDLTTIDIERASVAKIQHLSNEDLLKLVTKNIEVENVSKENRN